MFSRNEPYGGLGGFSSTWFKSLGKQRAARRINEFWLQELESKSNTSEHFYVHSELKQIPDPVSPVPLQDWCGNQKLSMFNRYSEHNEIQWNIHFYMWVAMYLWIYWLVNLTIIPSDPKRTRPISTGGCVWRPALGLHCHCTASTFSRLQWEPDLTNPMQPSNTFWTRH